MVYEIISFANDTCNEKCYSTIKGNWNWNANVILENIFKYAMNFATIIGISPGITNWGHSLK